MNPLVLVILVGALVLGGVGLVVWLVKRGTFEPDARNAKSSRRASGLTTGWSHSGAGTRRCRARPGHSSQ